MFSVPLLNVPAKPGETSIRRHPIVATKDLVKRYDESVTTILENFVHTVTRFPTRRHLGKRPLVNGVLADYEWMTYQEVHDYSRALAAGLRQVGLVAKECVGFYSINRVEWALAEIACMWLNVITVPLYETLGEESIQYICNQTELETVFCSKDKVPGILKLISKLGKLKRIVLFDSDGTLLDASTKEKCDEAQIEVLTLADIHAQGKRIVDAFEPDMPKPEDTFTICYTSGTTGLPKGVVLTHEVFVAELSGIYTFNRYKLCFSLAGSDVHISYLPLAHVFERMVIHVMVTIGAAIGFYQGNFLKLMEDVALLKPTFFIAVPRVLSRIYDKVMANVKAASPIKRFLFKMAYNWKRENLKAGRFRSSLFDPLVFNKIRAFLGGNVRIIVTGAAPISSEVLEFTRICFACEVYEGYGQTETCAASLVSLIGDWSTGHVGAPIPSVEVKLVDVPDMNYFASDKPFARGEICVRGYSCFASYYKDAEKTAETIDAEGWVHTGDIGMFDDRGRVRLIDRKKNIFKLAQGEYIAPEKIEMVIAKHEAIAQVFIDGDSLKNSVVAVVVPDFERICSVLHVAPSTATIESVCAMPEAKAYLMKEIGRLGSKGTAELKGFEIPSNIHLEPAAFSIENGLMTDTMKLKRFQAKLHYKEILRGLYATESCC